MRVFLDTNVVLTGAFNPRGPAGRLNSIVGRATFVHSPHVLAECDWLIGRYAPSAHVANIARQQLRNYLASLRSILVPDSMPPQGVTAHDSGDDPILGSATAASAKAICTYNVRDFPTDSISVSTPLTILRALTDSTLEHYIQAIKLSSHGTLLFFGRLHHPSSMGTILASSNGVNVHADETGLIHLTGPSVKRSCPVKALKGDEEFRLTLRYNNTDFEAALWSYSSTGWTKEVICTGAANFSEETKPVLFFVPKPSVFWAHSMYFRASSLCQG